MNATPAKIRMLTDLHQKASQSARAVSATTISDIVRDYVDAARDPETMVALRPWFAYRRCCGLTATEMAREIDIGSGQIVFLLTKLGMSEAIG